MQLPEKYAHKTPEMRSIIQGYPRSRTWEASLYTLVMFDSRRIQHINDAQYKGGNILYWSE